MATHTLPWLLLLLGAAGLVAPWIPFYEMTGPPAVSYAFVDLMFLPASADGGVQRLRNIVLTLPVFLPFLIVPWQGWRLTSGAEPAASIGRVAAVVAIVWVGFYAIDSLRLLPAQLASWVGSGGLTTFDSIARQALRMLGLMGSIGLGAWLLTRLLSLSGPFRNVDTALCAALTTYIVAVLPELVTNAVAATTFDPHGRLRPGYALLLWTCIIYGVSLVLACMPANRGATG